MIHAIIVEDDPMVAHINRIYMEEFQEIKVEECFHDGKSAWEYILNNRVDLVVLDLYMPILDGLEVLRKIRSSSIPVDVIMVTASNDAKIVDEMIRLGIIDYLIKPFEYLRFHSAIEKFLKKKNILVSSKTLNQDLIDGLISSNVATQPILPKGLQQQTLDMILEELEKESTRYYTCDELSDVCKLSSVTIRRYLNYLADQKLVLCKINYETKGRPSITYIKNNQTK